MTGICYTGQEYVGENSVTSITLNRSFLPSRRQQIRFDSYVTRDTHLSLFNHLPDMNLLTRCDVN